MTLHALGATPAFLQAIQEKNFSLAGRIALGATFPSLRELMRGVGALHVGIVTDDRNRARRLGQIAGALETAGPLLFDAISALDMLVLFGHFARGSRYEKAHVAAHEHVQGIAWHEAHARGRDEAVDHSLRVVELECERIGRASDVVSERFDAIDDGEQSKLVFDAVALAARGIFSQASTGFIVATTLLRG